LINDPLDIRVIVAAIRRTMDLAAHWPSNRKPDKSILSSWIELGYRTVNKPFSAVDLDVAARQTMKSRQEAGKVVPFARRRS
jgi:hypothetical protein